MPLIKNRNLSFFFLAFLLLFSSQIVAAEFKGRVVRVISGDTFILFRDGSQIKVLLAGVAAPKKTQPFFRESKKSLEELIFNKDVTVIEEKTINSKLLGKVYIGEPKLDIRCVMTPCYEQNHISVEQLHRGMAWVDLKYTEDSDLTKLQEEARLEKRGLWRDPHPVPPWKWQGKK